MEYLNAADLNDTKINSAIKEKLSLGDNTLTIKNIHAMHNVCAGLSGNCEIIIEDSTGLYTGSFMEGPKVIVEGNVGWYAGDDMMSGELIIKKNTGCNVGAYICGGDIVIYGNTGSRVGYGMKGGHIIVCGTAGRWAGQMAMGGQLIVLGAMGNQIGESMYTGKIFTMDPDAEKKLGGNVILDTIKDDEIEELDGLFHKYTIQAQGKDFKVVRPNTSGRHNYVLFKPDLKPEEAAKYTNGKMVK